MFISFGTPRSRLLARLVSHKWLLFVSLLILTSSPLSTQAFELPNGFSEVLVVEGLETPTTMTFAPDGRIFVGEQSGQIRIVQNNRLLPEPFLSLDVSPVGESGLLGIAFDPDFKNNQYVYVYYTSAQEPVHNRLSRFTAAGNQAEPGSEKILIDFDALNGATDHNGGGIHFGPDGKLYLGVGESTYPPNSQALYNLAGKILRINSDGSIPDDNPLIDQTQGRNQAIWALGLRNPFSFAFQPGTGRLFINDVGQSNWEEINEGIPGANYGWPTYEGAAADPDFQTPIYAYPHLDGNTFVGCAVTGGAFYNPDTTEFPEEYRGAYFFTDYCAPWIKRLDPASGAVTDFGQVSGSGIVDLEVTSTGCLYYLARAVQAGGKGGIYRIDYTIGKAPAIVANPNDVKVAVGEPAQFRCSATGEQPLAYQWQRNGENLPSATDVTYMIAETAARDDKALFRCLAKNDLGSATSEQAALTVIQGERPQPAIDLPSEGAQYSAGATIQFLGSAADAEDGVLPAQAFTWEVLFHHDEHTHPFIEPLKGVDAGSFTIPTTGETSANVWYRVHLTVVDASGLENTTYMDIRPQTINLTLETDPPGLQVKLDGFARPAPLTVGSVIGMRRAVGAVDQTVDGKNWTFDSWSTGEAAEHVIITPGQDTTYTVKYKEVKP